MINSFQSSRFARAGAEGARAAFEGSTNAREGCEEPPMRGRDETGHRSPPSHRPPTRTTARWKFKPWFLPRQERRKSGQMQAHIFTGTEFNCWQIPLNHYVVCCAVIIVFIFNWNVDHHPKGRRRDNRVKVQTSRRILLIFIVFVFESILKLVTLIVSSDKSSSVYAGLLHTQRQRPLFQIWSNPIFTGPQIQNAKKTQHMLYF